MHSPSFSSSRLTLRILAIVLAIVGTAASVAGQTHQVVHEFVADIHGPRATLVRGADGTSYGTATSGFGTYGGLFKITPAGEYVVLHHFSDYAADGSHPVGITLGSDGAIYGVTTYGGGSNGCGTLFKWTAASGLVTLHRFQWPGVCYPWAISQGSGGALYGTTEQSGNGSGAVFRWGTNGLEVLHSFSWNDGAYPYGGVIEAPDGALYGTTRYGGPNGTGTLYKLTSTGLQTLVTFGSGTGPQYPFAGLARDADGSFFGTTSSGGNSNSGTIFKWSPTSGLQTLHSFSYGDGAYPYGGVIKGSDGGLYGATHSGGTYGYGTLYKWTASGLSTLRSFQISDGAHALSGLLQEPDGKLVGATYYGGGGTNFWANGVVFRVGPDGSGFSALHVFGTGDRYPIGEPWVDAAGTVYGMTHQGGRYNYGTLYKLANGARTTLHEFNWNDGAYPVEGGRLIKAADGALYGTTHQGGTYGYGTLFKWTGASGLQTLHSFEYWADGAHPWGGLIAGADGALYGTTVSGGTGNGGTLFKWAGGLQTLHSFAFGADGCHPYGRLAQSADGAIYGTTYSCGANYGTLFKWETAGGLQTLHSFDYATGAWPHSGVAIGADGAVYGLTVAGGAADYGTLFKWTSAGHQVLHSFTGVEGGSPYLPLVQGPDGHLYGLTQWSTNGYGTIFRWNGSSVSAIHSFTPATGNSPSSGLSLGLDGNLYGSTWNGGSGNSGTIYRLTGFGASPFITNIGAPATPLAIGTAANVSVTYTDADGNSGHTCQIAWGDGTTTTATGSAGFCSSTRQYPGPGVYTLGVTVTDNTGRSANQSYEYVVIYDPSAGFVTGGGWIQSAPGAYAADLALTGKASFGFVSKYKKGMTVPTGDTEFNFSVAGFRFASSAYEWLVVAGARSQFKGTGTVNGTGSFGFLLTATDGQVAGGGGADKFRIKIWDKNTNIIVYDNVPAASDDADPQLIGGGSIVIHAK